MKIIYLLQGSKLRNDHVSSRYQSDPIYIHDVHTYSSTYIHTYNTYIQYIPTLYSRRL
jgi:hypothetical protein